MLLNLQKIYLETICLKKFFKISEENKLFKQASKFASDNCQSHGSKGFQPFCKGSQLLSQPTPQKAKARSNPSSRRVVFRSKLKRGASKSKRNLPLNRENQILSGKLVQINFRQDCFTNDKRTSNSFPILSKTTENNPSNSPSFEGRIRNIKSGNSILKRQRCYHGNSFNSSKVYKPTLYSFKTLRGEQPVINLAPLNNHIYNQPFKMEGLENLRYLLNPGDYFMKIDLSDAYLFIPVYEDSQPYLAFIFNQVTYAFKTMPFRLNEATA